MKLTPQRFMPNFSAGDEARKSRQHCSRVATHCPARRPSTFNISLPRFCSVVTLSIAMRAGPRPVQGHSDSQSYAKNGIHLSINTTYTYGDFRAWQGAAMCPYYIIYLYNWHLLCAHIMAARPSALGQRESADTAAFSKMKVGAGFR